MSNYVARAPGKWYSISLYSLKFQCLLSNGIILALLQQIAVILQYKSRTANQNVPQLQNRLKESYVNFGFAVLDFMLRESLQSAI